MKITLTLFSVFLSILIVAQVHTGSVYGVIKDKNTQENLPFVTVLLFENDTTKVAAATTDFDGNYEIKNIKNGVYKIKASFVGYHSYELKNIKVEGQKTLANIQMDVGNLKLSEVQVVTYNTCSKNLSSGVVNFTSVRGSRSGNKNTFNTEEYDKIDDNEFKEVSKSPLSTFSADVDKASYSNVRRYLMSENNLPPADAVRIEEMINYFNYNYPNPKGNDPFSITTQYTDCPWNSGHQLVHIGMKSKDISLENMPANNLVLLIDVSGSMSSPDKLPLLKSGLGLLIDQMRPQDKVSIVVYAGAAGLVLEPTSGKNKEKIYAALEELESGGSTAGGEGILLAYKTAKENYNPKANNRVILATDGDFNVGVSSDGDLIRMIEKERESGVFLTVLGFGSGNIKDSKMEKLADKGNGNYAYIDNLLEAKKTLVKEMGGTLLTVAKDVKLQVEFNPAKVKAYRLVGYENRLLNDEDFNDDKKDAGDLGAGHMVTAIYELIPAGSSETISGVDTLKYQEPLKIKHGNNNEVMTIKFRYKEPKELKSKLITQVVEDKKISFEGINEDCRFSCAVAMFGMILRDSKFKGNADYKNVIVLAKASKGNDDEGYRAEFIKMVEAAELIKQVGKN